MELVAYIRLFRKWLWLIFLGAFLCGGAAFIYTSSQTLIYEAKATVSVGGFIQSPDPTYSDIQTGTELAQTYTVIAQTTTVLKAAIDAKDFPISVEDLRASLTTSVIPDTSLLVLAVRHSDPTLAIEMANEVAKQLIINSPSNLTPEQQNQIDLANSEIERMNQQLAEARTRKETISAQLQSTTDQVERERLEQEFNTVVEQINETSATIAQYTAIIADLQQRTNSLSIVETASSTSVASGGDYVIKTVLGAIVGGALAMGVALLIEYLDDTVQTVGQGVDVLKLMPLAAVPRFGKRRDTYPRRLIIDMDTGSPVLEEYRTLRTNLLFSPNGNLTKATYIITSPGPSEGKSVTTANLAVTLAMAGWRVLLVDADLRRPKLHEIFELDNQVGLSTLLAVEAGEAVPNSNGNSRLPRSLRGCLQETKIPGLRVITSGFAPLNPTEVLGSTTMQHLYQEFRSSTNIDIILFDTPPSLVVADSSVLASAVKAPVVLVFEAGHTRLGAAAQTKERLEALDIEIKGFVLNAVNPRGQQYGYGYSYYYYRDEPHAQAAPERGVEYRK
jgi:non-specific protein-tyrosine kinase